MEDEAEANINPYLGTLFGHFYPDGFRLPRGSLLSKSLSSSSRIGSLYTSLNLRRSLVSPADAAEAVRGLSSYSRKHGLDSGEQEAVCFFAANMSQGNDSAKGIGRGFVKYSPLREGGSVGGDFLLSPDAREGGGQEDGADVDEDDADKRRDPFCLLMASFFPKCSLNGATVALQLSCLTRLNRRVKFLPDSADKTDRLNTLLDRVEVALRALWRCLNGGYIEYGSEDGSPWKILSSFFPFFFHLLVNLPPKRKVLLPLCSIIVMLMRRENVNEERWKSVDRLIKEGGTDAGCRGFMDDVRRAMERFDESLIEGTERVAERCSVLDGKIEEEALNEEVDMTNPIEEDIFFDAKFEVWEGNRKRKRVSSARAREVRRTIERLTSMTKGNGEFEGKGTKASDVLMDVRFRIGLDLDEGGDERLKVRKFEAVYESSLTFIVNGVFRARRLTPLQSSYAPSLRTNRSCSWRSGPSTINPSCWSP